MTKSEMEAVEFWQTSCEGIAERKLDDLTQAIDDLTSLAHSRAGVQTIRARYPVLVDAIRRMHDLILDFKPVEKVS